MKKIALILTLIPFIVQAQKSLTNRVTLPLIESICTDTIHGKYQETTFAYDRFNRVTRIVNRMGHLIKSNNTTTDLWVIDTNAIQSFEYVLDKKAPVLKRNTSYKSNSKGGKWITGTETYYYIYRNGKRVMDSVVEKQNNSNGETGLNRYKTTYEQTDSTLTRFTNLSTRNYPSEYQNDLIFHKNVFAEENSYNHGNPGSWTVNYTFTNFDNKINPFSQLNIAPILLDERIRFSFTKAELINLNTDFDKEGTEVNWHLNNQNNLLRSTIKRPDQESDAKDIISYSYTYNENKLPVYCTIYVKKISTIYQGTAFRSGYLKHFTFRYRK